jgi:L-alanine-DL-glutamate epimerase-like enolase superfamily enzyme
MKIKSITVWQLDLPLHKPYWLSGGRLKFELLDSTIVRIDTDEGISGWGEGCPWGVTYLPAFGKGIRAGLEELAPLLIGRDPRQLDSINRVMDLALPGHPYIKAALDIERIDLLGANERAAEIMFYDANRAWLPREAITVLNSIAGVSSWFEQPCETLDEIAQVRRQTRYPICVDEGLHGIEDLIRIQRDGIAELVNIKINRVGGLTKARRMRDLCLATGITMLVMDTGGSVLSDTAVAHFAQTIPASSCLGAWSCQEMVNVDPAPGQGARNVDGCFSAPDLPGLGVEPELARLGAPLAVYQSG